MNTQIVVFIVFFVLLVVAARAWQLRQRAKHRAQAPAARVPEARVLPDEPPAPEAQSITLDAPAAPAPSEPPTSTPQLQPYEPVLEAVQVARDALAPDAARRVRHPIVLAHGLMGFDTIGFGRLKHAYFRGV